MHKQQSVLLYRTFQVNRCEMSWERADHTMHFQEDENIRILAFLSKVTKKNPNHPQLPGKDKAKKRVDTPHTTLFSFFHRKTGKRH